MHFMASIRGSSSSASFLMPLDVEGKVAVHELLLSLKFNFKVRTMSVEKEICYDEGEILETVFQLKLTLEDEGVWSLSSGSIRCMACLIRTCLCRPFLLLP